MYNGDIPDIRHKTKNGHPLFSLDNDVWKMHSFDTLNIKICRCGMINRQLELYPPESFIFVKFPHAYDDIIMM